MVAREGAALDVGIDTSAVTPVRKRRQLGGLFVAVGFVVVNFIVDMLYAVLDPRIRHGRA